MAFCIYCGAENPAGAIFCQGCGQTFYHEPQKNKTPIHRRRFILVISILAVLAAVIVVVSIKKTSTSDLSTVAPDKTHDIPTSPADAVLTVVGTSRKGAFVSQGSGFILTADGLAGTNYHVLKGAAEAFAECCNGRKFDIASIEGTDLDKDLIVFQLLESGTRRKPEGLPHVTLGSWKDVSVGDKVIAIGSPEGLANSISDGILSAVRESDSVHYLQMTAPISPGSSGGPVLNAAGQMIGVATFQLEEGQNLNFAVAADHVRPLLDQHLQMSIHDFQSMVREAQLEQRTARPDRTAPPAETQKRLIGQFGGIVHNKSADLSAEFAVIVREDDGILSGCMLVAQPLFGSGPLAGFADDSGISFAVTSAIGTISFAGKGSGESINGKYTVDRKDGGSEDGTFTLRKLKAKGPGKDFDPAKCPTDADVNQ